MHDLYFVKTFFGSILGFLLVACGGVESAALEPSTSVARLRDVTNTADSAVAPDRVGTRTGQLRRRGYANVGTTCTSVAVDPSGKFVYVASHGSGDVSAYTINANTGALIEIAGSPFAAGDGPHCVAIDPAGKFAYVANQDSNTVSVHTIDATTGALSNRQDIAGRSGNRVIAIVKDAALVRYTPKFAFVTKRAHALSAPTRLTSGTNARGDGANETGNNLLAVDLGT